MSTAEQHISRAELTGAQSQADYMRQGFEDAECRVEYWRAQCTALQTSLRMQEREHQRDAEKARNALRPQPLKGRSLCASTLCGRPVLIEYGTYTDNDGRPALETFAIWSRGERFELGEQEFTAEQLAAWQSDAEAAEITAGEGYAEPGDLGDDGSAAAAAEDRETARRDHAHYSRSGVTA